MKNKQVCHFSNMIKIRQLETRLVEGRGLAHMHGTRFPAFVVPIVAFLSGFREDAVVTR